MGIQNREGALYMATGFDNSGLYKGKHEAIGIIKAMAGEITSFDVFGGIGISAGIAFAKAAKDAYTFEKEFQKSMYEVATISGQIKGSLTDYMNSIMDMTRKIPVAANDSAKALYQIVSAGHDGADAMKVLEISAKAAIGGVTDTATAADAITTLINAYKMSTDDAEKVSDQLFTTARLGKTTFGELGRSIAQVAPIAASYGVEMDQVLAAVSTLTKSGTPTAQAMTQIRAAIIGVSKYLGDGAFNTMTFQEALDLVAKKANGSENALRAMITEVEGVTGLLGLTGINAKAAAGDLDEMNSSAGATETAFKKMAESADAQLQLLSNNITATLRPLGESILKEVSNVAKKMNDAFNNGDIESSLQTMETLIKLVSVAFVGYKVATLNALKTANLETTITKLSTTLKVAYQKTIGDGIIQKERERLSQEAYISSLEKTLNTEQRSKLSKMNLKARSEEYSIAIRGLKEKEKEAADKLVTVLGRETSAAEKSMAIAKQKMAIASDLVATRKQELAALTSTVQAEKMATTQKELARAKDIQRIARENAIALNRQKVASQQAIIAAKESGQSATKIAILEREIQTVNKKVVTAKAEYNATTQVVVAKKNEIATINLGITSKKIETATNKLNMAVEKENIASVAANAAMKDFYSKKSATAIASTKASSIATALNSAQQRANAAATALSTSAHNFLAAAKLKAAIATRTLTAAFAANPIGALLTVVSLAASAWLMFSGNTEKAKTKLQEFREEQDKLKESTNDMINTLYDENESDRIRMEVLEKLRTIYPEIYKDITLENLALKNRNAILKETNTLRENEAEANLKNQINSLTSTINAKKAEVSKIKDDMTSKAKKQQDVTIEANDFVVANEEINKQEKVLKELEKTYYGVQLAKQKLIEETFPVDTRIVIYEKELKSLQIQIEETKKKIGEATDAKNQFSLTGWGDTPGVNLPIAVSFVDTFNIQLLQEKYDEVEKKLNESKSEKDIKNTSSREIGLTDAEKQKAEKRKNTLEEISKTVLDVEIKLQQERVAIMADGRRKALAEIEIDKKSRLNAIDDEEKELSKKYKSVGKNIPKNISDNFTNRRKAVTEDASYKSKETNKDYDRQEIEFQKELSSVFLTEEEKRKQSIKDRYDEMRRLQKQAYDNEVRNIDLTKTGKEAWNESTKALMKFLGIINKIDCAQVAEESKDKRETYNSLVAQLDDFKSREYTLNTEWDKKIAESKATGDADLIERMKQGKEKAQSELHANMLQQSDSWKNLFANLDTLTAEQISKLIKDIESQMASGNLKLNPVDYKALVDSLNQARDKVVELNPFKALGSYFTDYRKALDELEKAKKNGLSGEDLIPFEATVKKSAQGVVKSIGDITSVTTEVGNSFASMFESFGNDKLADGLGTAVEVMGELGKTAGGVGKIMAGDIVGGIKDIITGITSIFTIFNKAKDNKLQKSIENSERSVKKLTWAFEDLERAREKAEGDGKDLYTDKIVENLKKQQEELKKQQQAERQKKKADQEKISDLGREYEKLGQQIEDIKEDAFNEKLQENIEKSERAVKKLEWAFNDLKRAMDKTLGEAKYDYVPKLLENIRKKQEEILRQIDEENRKTNPDQGKLDELRRSYEEFNQQIEDLIEDLKNDFIGGTAQDIAQRLGDAFIEAFAKGEDAAKTWQKSVKEIIGDIVKRMLITKLFEVPIGNILDEFWEKYSGKSTTDNDSGKDDPNNNNDKNNPSSRPSGSGSNNSGRVQSDHPRESGDRPSSDNIGNKNDRPSGNNPSYAPAAPGNKNKEEGQKEFKFIPIVTGCPGPTAPVKPNPVIPMKPGQVTPGNKAEVDKGTDQSDAIKWLNDALMGFNDGLEDSMKPFMDILNKFLGEGSIEDGVSGQLQSAMTEGTGSQLVGLWNMTALDIRALKDLSAEHFDEFKLCQIDVDLILQQTRLIQANTLRTANNTDGLKSVLEAMKGELEDIKKNTKTYKGRG